MPTEDKPLPTNIIFISNLTRGDSPYERGGYARRLAEESKFRILVSVRVVWAKRYQE